MVKEGNSGGLLERYLQAVGFLLPEKQRHDVVRELEEHLRSEIDEKEAERGRPLDEEEMGGLLRRFGHPAMLALRYQQGRGLISPSLFPVYWFAVRFVLGVLAVVHLLLPALFFLIQGERSGIVGLFTRFPAVALPVFAWMTLGFALLDTAPVRSRIERALSDWNPRSLPPVVAEEPSRPPAVARLVLDLLLSMWWLLGLRFPPLILGPAAAFVEFGPIFQPLFVPMAIAAAARFLLGWIRLTRPHLIRLHWFAGLLVDGLGLVVVLFLARGGEWMVAGERLRTVEGMRVLDTVNFAMGMALLVALVVCALSFSWKYLMGPIWWRSMSSRSS